MLSDESGLLNKKRGPIEIIENILTIIKDYDPSMCKTHIMYLSNLNWKQLTAYIDFLEKRELIRIIRNNNGKEVYHITDKGIEFLKACDYIKRLLSGEGI